jgi:hypothetical protein
MLKVLLAVVLMAQVPASRPTRDTTDAGTGSLAGRVTERGTDRPLFRALVTLLSADRSRRRETLTDPQGRYAFTELPAGGYTLWAEPGDHRSTHLRQIFGQPDPADPGVMPPRAVLALAAGEHRSGADLALSRALGIEGRVLDSVDDPMPDVEVTAVGVDGESVPMANNRYTDDRGEYRLFGLRPGRYRVCAVAQNTPFTPQNQPTRLVRTCYPASAGEPAAADVVLAGDDAVGIDIRMQRSGTYSASGSVYDAAGGLAEGVSVYATAAVEHATSSRGATVKEGRYELSGLTPGTYLVLASVGGSREGDGRPATREREAGFAVAEIGNADVAGLDLRMSKGATITGRVWFEDGNPPRPSQLHMIVQLQRLGVASRSFERPPYAPVDERLTFELRDVFRWPQMVGLQNLPEGWAVKSVSLGTREITGIATDLGADGLAGRLDIRLTRKVASPRVRVTAADGRPVTSYHAVLLPRDPARWEAAALAAWREPAADGVVPIGPCLPGEYLVAAISASDYRVLMNDRARVAALASHATPVSFVEGDARIVELRLSALPPRQ